MNYWLMKSEPTTFGIDDLKNCPKKTDCWDGVRNYQARNFMRDAMRLGDLALFYHSNCKIPGIVGTMEIVSAAYPDHSAVDIKSKYYDPKSTLDAPRWFMVDVKFKTKFSNIISLETLRANNNLKSLVILRPGNRLSITPVTKQEWQIIMKLAQ